MDHVLHLGCDIRQLHMRVQRASAAYDLPGFVSSVTIRTMGPLIM